MGMYSKKIRRSISVLIAMLIVILYVLPCSISFAASSYGFQGKAGNSIRMNSYDVSVVEETDDYYLNSINESLNASKSIKFAITMSAGMNSYGDGSSFRRNCMPHIKIYDSSESHVVAEYDEGNGLFKYYSFDSSTKNIYIGVDKGVLPEGDYVLVFGSDVCGNNVAKKLGVPVKFKFSTYLGEPGDDGD
ncbi:MAG: hypothetical protein ACI3VR_01815, partial [Intestinibacter sp.]|uniref:hypothetical protein n=1 Tax=Intestinibacter sp. TaxID=1965304 RepID=UPI003F1666CC